MLSLNIDALATCSVGGVALSACMHRPCDTLAAMADPQQSACGGGTPRAARPRFGVTSLRPACCRRLARLGSAAAMPPPAQAPHWMLQAARPCQCRHLTHQTCACGVTRAAGVLAHICRAHQGWTKNASCDPRGMQLRRRVSMLAEWDQGMYHSCACLCCQQKEACCDTKAHAVGIDHTICCTIELGVP